MLRIVSKSYPILFFIFHIQCINDEDVQALNVGWVRNQISLVSQEPVLFDRSIAENIAYGDNCREVGHNEITAVAKQANIHDFIESLPNVSYINECCFSDES